MRVYIDVFLISTDYSILLKLFLLNLCLHVVVLKRELSGKEKTMDYDEENWFQVLIG